MSCGDDIAQSSKKVKTIANDIIYSSSDVSLNSELDSISYVIVKFHSI